MLKTIKYKPITPTSDYSKKIRDAGVMVMGSDEMQSSILGVLVNLAERVKQLEEKANEQEAPSDS